MPEGVRQITNFPPGTGPFKLVKWQPKQRTFLERFDGYWGHKPYVDRFVMRPIKNDTVRFTALWAGDMDGRPRWFGGGVTHTWLEK